MTREHLRKRWARNEVTRGGPEQTASGNLLRCGFQLLARVLEGRRRVLIWVPQKADLETKIWVQTVYLGSDLRKQSECVGDRDTGAKTVSYGCLDELLGYWAGGAQPHLELSRTGISNPQAANWSWSVAC